MSSERESNFWLTAALIAMVVMFALGRWDGTKAGRAQGRAEQEAFDHKNALKIENRCREVPEPCVIMRQDTYDRLMMNAITSSLGIPKPHKAAPKVPAVIDVEPGAPFTVGNGWTFTCITVDLEKRTVTGTCPKDPPAGLQGPPMFSLPQCTRDTNGLCTSPVAQLE